MAFLDSMYPATHWDGHWKTVTQMKPDLAVGSFVMWPKLAADGWRCLLLADAAPNVPLPHLKHKLIDGTGNARQRLQEAIAFVVRGWNEGAKMAVLCRSGANRAPAIAAASMFVARRSGSVFRCIEWFRGLRPEVGHYRGTTSEVEDAAVDMVDWKIKEVFLVAPNVITGV